MLELKDGSILSSEAVLEELAKPLSSAAGDGKGAKEWFSASNVLCQKVYAWVVADDSQRPELAKSILVLLKAAEEALAGQAFLAGPAVTAADVSYAAALAGFYQAVRHTSQGLQFGPQSGAMSNRFFATPAGIQPRGGRSIPEAQGHGFRHLRAGESEGCCGQCRMPGFRS